MKKRYFILIALLLCSASLFAYTDNFYSTSTNREYVALVSAIKNGKDEDVILNEYNAYIYSDITPVERARVEYHIARYYRDVKKKDTAREHIFLMRELIDNIDKNTISDFEQRVLEIEYYSAKYYVDKKMSDGMENSSLTKELYSLYPDDVFSIMTEAWRLIYTPGIAGGSPRKAIRMLNSFLDGYKDKMCTLDLYSTYCALAIAHNMRDDYDDAEKYFKLALGFYDKEADIVDAYKENTKELEKQLEE